MPSTRPRFVIRASQDQIDAWKSSGGSNVNEWAMAALDGASGFVSSDEGQKREAVKPRARARECPNARHHRPHVFCKTCGIVA